MANEFWEFFLSHQAKRKSIPSYVSLLGRQEDMHFGGAVPILVHSSGAKFFFPFYLTFLNFILEI